jgi:DNA helicase-2/ATP-dependent DNA helicase PcrA
LEEERRLCYVGMTRAMNTLILTRAHYRRRYGNDAPEMSIPSRFLEEVPNQLVENLGGRAPAWSTPGYGARTTGYGGGRRPGQFNEYADQHYNYEDESQEAFTAGEKRATPGGGRGFGTAGSSPSKPFVASWMTAKAKPASSDPAARGQQTPQKDESAQARPEAQVEGHSIDNIARFFGGKAGALKPGAHPRPPSPRPPMDIPATHGAAILKKGQRVRHSKYGEGTILMREGEGEDAKLTVHFIHHGLKKLMEKFANLQKL